jgi:hypothetical protein
MKEPKDKYITYYHRSNGGGQDAALEVLRHFNNG